MHLKSLKVYCDIVRLGSFSKAATANGVSQPSASQIVHGLEERLGVQLLDRTRRPFVVTPEGRRYYEGCREVVRSYEQLERSIRELHNEAAARLAIGAIYSVGFGQVHQLLHEFRTGFPAADLRVEYMHPDEVYDAVEAGEVDLGIVSYPEGSKRLSFEMWREEPFAVAVAPGRLLLPELGGIDPGRLSGEPAVMPQEGLRIREEIDRFLAAHGVRVEVAAEFDNLEAVKGAIEAGEGWGLLPAPVFENEVMVGTLRRVDLVLPAGAAPLVRPLGLLRRSDEQLGPLGEAFVRLLRRRVASQEARA